MEESVRGVGQILKAIAAGDAEAAAAASDKHLQRAADLALRAMQMAKCEQKGSLS
jgi:DNA-binding GntR family transcriptional regulator